MIVVEVDCLESHLRDLPVCEQSEIKMLREFFL